MEIEMDVSLDPTLGCGQAHRWKKVDGAWKGVIGQDRIELVQTGNGFLFKGTTREKILDYFRHGDDLSSIMDEISSKDAHVAKLATSCPGMRILRQDPWECTATYILATNANVKRISKMVESVCDRYGTDLGGVCSFPTPKQILNGCETIEECRLGYRADRFVEFAQKTEDGEYDLESLRELDYQDCITELQRVSGIGPKVADCVALFAYGHLESFPVDARISRVMRDIYGVDGNYKRTAEAGRAMFGRYAGYAQELLYHSMDILY
ncbi:MAG TPA: DNA glycosylase [Candidatus Methanomethylophilaceae archaeon]|nr:DNA glycosylase [Candidatus Methanomethylophilaceae archaeon]